MNLPVSGLFSLVIAVSWQSSPVICLVLIARPLLGAGVPARWRYALWTLVLVRLMVPLSCLPSSAISLQRIHALDEPIEHVQDVVGDAMPPTPNKNLNGASVQDHAVAVPVPAPTSPISVPWRDIAAFSWLSVMLGGLSLIAAVHAVFARRITIGRVPLPERTEAIWNACCRRFELKRAPDLWISSSVDSPLLFGFLHPRLVLPAASAESHTREEYEHIFAHELGHYQRADHWTNALQLLILAVHWFNPLVWLSFRSARLDREIAADEWALRHLDAVNPKVYGETLLKFVSGQSGLGMLQATLGIAESKAQLKSRLKRIVRFGNHSVSGSILGFCILILLAIPALSSETGTLGGIAGRGTIYDRNGVVLAENQPADGKRFYPYEALGAHLIGWLGPKDTQAGTPATTGPIVGRQGVEGVMEPVLKAGGDVYLTIDARMQFIAENALRSAGVTHGAVIIMDPRNGDILALVSAPSFDPNTLASDSDGEKFRDLSSDASSPLRNRAISGSTSGSTFKILTALAGLKSGRMSPDTEFDCPTALPIDDHVFHNSDHTAVGKLNLINAICFSNDVYFYQYGIKTGIAAIDEMGDRVGFGQKWGVLGDRDEDPGILPGPEWMKQNENWLQKTHISDHWSNAQTANTAIGQGFVLVTPLQMTVFYSAVANGGTVYRPRLYERIVPKGGKVERKWTEPAQVFNVLGLKSGDLETVRQAMLEVVEKGTGTNARIPGIDIAGKTGTAQSYARVDGAGKRLIMTWFSCFAPYDAPRYTVTVLVQGGVWGSTPSAPIAQDILMQLFALENGKAEKMGPLKPVTGPYSYPTTDFPFGQ
jgi:cell division protein FtsI/penicillin-binding protein 2/beta-lactamase regulating signal transducer with metallopeptidase domain